MSNELSPESHPEEPMVYRIRIKGHLVDHWTEWFDGLTITLEEDGNTLLTGTVLDQAAKKSARSGHDIVIGQRRQSRSGRSA